MTSDLQEDLNETTPAVSALCMLMLADRLNGLQQYLPQIIQVGSSTSATTGYADEAIWQFLPGQSPVRMQQGSSCAVPVASSYCAHLEARLAAAADTAPQ